MSPRRAGWLGPVAAVVVVGAMVAFTLVISSGGCEVYDPVRRAVRREIRAQIEDSHARRRWFSRSRERSMVGNRDVAPLVLRFYERRGFDPAWSTGRGLTDDASELAAALTRSGRDGLDPADVQAAQVRAMLAQAMPASSVPGGADPRDLAETDILLTRSFFKQAAHVQAGVVDPSRLPSDWHIRPRQADLVAVLERALARHDVPAALDRLEPPYPGYAALRDLLARYRAVARAGGWPIVGPGPVLRPRSGGARVARLRERLAATGDLDAAAGRGGAYDAALADAVRRFQARHGLPTSGTVGARDVAELDVPVGARIRQIELNLERWRWLPATLGERYVEVNIPGFALELRDRGRLELAMRVVVGKELSRTPMFSDSITYLAFNPTWDVPPDIARKEMLPAEQEDPQYLAKNHLRLFTGHGRSIREVDPASVDWKEITPETFAFAVKQDPGPDNSIGRVKFACPNPYQIYLHDTPAGHLFGVTDRDFSHGCVRVERPLDLAIALLRGKAGWDSARVAAAMDSEKISVRLPKPVPVHILYWTTWVDDEGRAQFRRDVYAVDSLLTEALARGRNQPVPGVEWGRLRPDSSAAGGAARRPAGAETASLPPRPAAAAGARPRR